MIFMPVRKQYSAHLILVLHEIGDVGHHKIDSRHVLVVRKRKSGVHHDNVVAVFDRGHVLADFAHAA